MKTNCMRQITRSVRRTRRSTGGVGGGSNLIRQPDGTIALVQFTGAEMQKLQRLPGHSATGIGDDGEMVESTVRYNPGYQRLASGDACESEGCQENH
ncbi:hypothetical protein ACNKHW_06610 [Shigella flexneri]